MLETGDVASIADDVWRLETGDVAAIYRKCFRAAFHFSGNQQTAQPAEK